MYRPWSSVTILCGALLLAQNSRGGPDTRPTADLLKAASQIDPAIAMPAILALADRPDSTAPLIIALKTRLEADASIIRKHAVTIDPGRLKLIEQDLESVRQKARANLEKLDKGDTLTAARSHHLRLRELLMRVNPIQALRWQLIHAVHRRAQCITMLAKLTNQEPPAEDPIARIAKQPIGLEIADALKLIDRSDVDDPRRDDPEYGLWYYNLCRKIEAYNKTMTAAGNRWERDCIRLTNDYRECLGMMPMEIDPRLMLSARRHSKEMVDLKYFGHVSPTPGRRSSVERMKLAGYLAGYSENIAMNVGDPLRAFEIWFNSPPHHRAMTAENEIAVGCGRWDNAWTMHFGHGMRLRLKSEDEKQKELAAAAPDRPDYLKAQGDDTKLPPVHSRIETDITLIDPSNPAKRIKVTVPGNEKEKE